MGQSHPNVQHKYAHLSKLIMMNIREKNAICKIPPIHEIPALREISVIRKISVIREISAIC